jgi:hypothetical protein
VKGLEWFKKSLADLQEKPHWFCFRITATHVFDDMMIDYSSSDLIFCCFLFFLTHDDILMVLSENMENIDYTSRVPFI